jgi:hypothetical protein
MKFTYVTFQRDRFINLFIKNINNRIVLWIDYSKQRHKDYGNWDYGNMGGWDMGEETVLIEYLGNTPIIRITDFLLENRLFDYSKKQIIDETGLAKATFYKYWGRIVEIGIVKATRSFGKTKLYRINEQSPVVQQIKKLELVLIESTAPQPATAKMRVPA